MHSIKNIGKDIAQGIVWANEELNFKYPDLKYKVNEKFKVITVVGIDQKLFVFQELLKI